MEAKTHQEKNISLEIEKKLKVGIKEKDVGKFEQKKIEILEVAKQYVDMNGKMDVGKFRKEKPNLYSLLNYYFKGVKGLLFSLNAFVAEDKSKKASGRGCPVNAQSVRNELAYDMLLLLRKNHTLAEIGEMYGVSRAHIHQLLQTMGENTYLEKRPIKLETLV